MEKKTFSDVHVNNTDRNAHAANFIPDDEKIELLDGTVVQGYKRNESADGQDVASVVSSDQKELLEKTDQKKIFLQNAFFLLAHAEEIKSDSRMLLAHVPVISGLAYCGPFPAPTLGVYIEWWLNTPEAMIEIKGTKFLVWHIAGSPLSGSNCCSIVNERGESRAEGLPAFSRIFRSFCTINSRYQKIKDHFKAYTIEEVVNILHERKDNDKERRLQVDTYFLRNRVKYLTERKDWL